MAKTAIITCSTTVSSRLLGCTTEEMSKMERVGLLRHSSFWKDHGVSSARGFMREHWATYDVRHYDIADLIALLPAGSSITADLKQLESQFRHQLKAGQVELTSWGMPYIGMAITPAGKAVRDGWYRRVPKRPQTLPSLLSSA